MENKGMITVSADQFTRQQLGLSEHITEDQARRVCEKIADDRNFKAGLSNDKLVIQRFIRD